MCIDRIACAQLPIFPSIYRGYKGVGGVDRDLQRAKVTTISLCMGSRTEGVAVGKKVAWKFTFNVYASPSIDMVGAVSLVRLKADKPTFTDENWSERYSAASMRPV